MASPAPSPSPTSRSSSDPRTALGDGSEKRGRPQLAAPARSRRLLVRGYRSEPTSRNSPSTVLSSSVVVPSALGPAPFVPAPAALDASYIAVPTLERLWTIS